MPPKHYGGCSLTAAYTTVFGGDFQQTLPVVVNGTRQTTVDATIQRSYIWQHVEVLHLYQNMRVNNDRNRQTFSDWLLDVGHGRNRVEGKTPLSFPLPVHMSCHSEDQLIERVYGSMEHSSGIPPPEFFRDRAILAPRNDDMRSLNTRILASLPGERRTYDSADSYSIESPTADNHSNIPLEFLHSLNASGLPVAHLQLKVGCPVLILRNIDTKRGLCNGTRATVIRLSSRVLEVRLLGGDHDGETALIPRITLSPSVTGFDFAIKLKRRQYPIQLAFAMTINKSQGQTISRVGIDLRKPIFAHGQLYVALSRSTSSERISVLLPPDCETSHTTNVVYNEILLD